MASSHHKDPTLNIVKFQLILGVVLIHCNLFASYESTIPADYNMAGRWMVEFISARLCAVCVPGFFIISGFLFFHNCKNFTFQDWTQKLKKRSRSLLLPYILWNLMGCALALAKIKWLGFPGYGLLENNSIYLPRLLEGFVDFANGYPYAFAFWFIRNLIVFVIISPIAYFLARNKWIFSGFILALCVTDTYIFGFEYFTIGAFMALHFHTLKSNTTLAWIGGIIWFAGQLLLMQFKLDYGSVTISLFTAVGAILFMMKVVALTAWAWQSEVMRRLVAATFFIYAIHQFFCTATRTFYISIFGLQTFMGIFLSYLLSFLTLTLIPFMLWSVMRKLTPRLVAILSGGR